MPLNLDLLELARRRHVKQAFVPSDAVASAGQPPAPGGGGPPPGPPAGGPPSGGDPGAGGPPPDPAMMGGGGMPPMPGGGAPMGDIDAKVQQAVQQAMQTANPAAGGAGGAGAGGKPPKPDINVVATDLFQLKKMFLAYLRRQGVELPPDILDGPNRDPNTGNASASPTGGSDVPPAPQMTPGAIQPIEPIQSASPMPKQASAMRPAEAAAFILKEASDVLRLYAAIKDREAVLEDLLMEEPVVEKKSEDEAIYGKACGPGTPCITASSKVRSKAAAINKIFLARRARAI